MKYRHDSWKEFQEEQIKTSMAGLAVFLFFAALVILGGGTLIGAPREGLLSLALGLSGGALWVVGRGTIQIKALDAWWAEEERALPPML